MTRLVKYLYKRFKKKRHRDREREQSIYAILNEGAYHLSASASGFTQE